MLTVSICMKTDGTGETECPQQGGTTGLVGRLRGVTPDPLGWIQVTCPTKKKCSTTSHLRRSSIDMDIRSSFSRMKKKVKRLGNKHKPGKTPPDVDEENVGPVNSPLRPEPQVIAGDGEEDDQGGGEAGVDGREGSQRYSHLDSAIEVVVGSGPGPGRDDADEDGEHFYSQSSTHSTPHRREPDSMWTSPFRLLLLIIPSDNIGTSTAPECISEALYPDKRVEPSAATDENRSDQRSTSSAMALLLRGVRDSLNGFGPLKSIAGSLCFILENCDVWPSSHTFDPECL